MLTEQFQDQSYDRYQRLAQMYQTILKLDTSSSVSLAGIAEALEHHYQAHGMNVVLEGLSEPQRASVLSLLNDLTRGWYQFLSEPNEQHAAQLLAASFLIQERPISQPLLRLATMMQATLHPVLPQNKFAQIQDACQDNERQSQSPRFNL